MPCLKSTFTTRFIKRFSEIKCCSQTTHAFLSKYSSVLRIESRFITSMILCTATILAKMCGTKCLFPELLQYSLAPPFSPDAMLDDSSASLSLRTTLHGGRGRKVGFGPKNVCFHVKNWSMVEAVHSASLSHIILARIVWMWRLNIKVRVTSKLSNVSMSNLAWLMFVTFCLCSIQMRLFEEKLKRFTELHERILGYGARFGHAEIWSK